MVMKFVNIGFLLLQQVIIGLLFINNLWQAGIDGHFDICIELAK